MELNALATSKLVTLMIFGGVFALVGLWLMIRPRPDTGRSKIELFGLKFESSSAGILVFLFGAAFLALPVFVDERIATPPPKDSPGPDRDARQPPPDVPEDSDITYDTPTTWRLEGNEKEPNNSIAAANLLPPGGAVAGILDNADHDYFRISAGGDADGDMVVTLSGPDLRLQIYDEYGEQIFNDFHFGEAATTFRGPAADGPYIARALCHTVCTGSRDYQITAAARPAG